MGDRLKDKVALVLGAGTVGKGAGMGNGRAICLVFAREGARLAGVDVREAAAAETAAMVAEQGGTMRALAGDVTNERALQQLVDETLASFGRIDVLVNNARYVGPGHMDAFEDTPLELIERMFLCNVIAPLGLIKLCLPAWKAQGSGIVINITSAAGQTETPRAIGRGGWGLGYSITKAAFGRMVPGLAKELRPHNVAVIGLMPGFVGTERTRVELREFGFDTSTALPVENPGRVCAMLATASDPMYFSGRDLHGPSVYAEHERIRFDG